MRAIRRHLPGASDETEVVARTESRVSRQAAELSIAGSALNSRRITGPGKRYGFVSGTGSPKGGFMRTAS